LLIEDDAMLGAAVCQALRDSSYAADWLQDGRSASSALAHHVFEMVLLDLGLPGRDGLEVLRGLRGRGDFTPVIVITARDSLEQRIQGLDGGADDYIVKPFAVAELLARMRALTRRRNGSGQPLLSNGTISLDPAFKVARIGDRQVALSAREYALLRELLVRPGAVLSRSELEDRIYGWDQEIGSNVVEYIIHGLRRKLGASSIRNVRGLGWMVARDAS
jgi:two-component system OmpR family response regulator